MTRWTLLPRTWVASVSSTRSCAASISRRPGRTASGAYRVEERAASSAACSWHRVWWRRGARSGARPRGVLPDDPLVHAAVLVFASDRGLLSTAARPHGLMWGARQGMSLDHAVWLHGAVRFDDWVLQTSTSPIAAAGRGLVLGAM